MAKSKADEAGEFDAAYTARWRRDASALYCETLKRRAAQAGLLDSPEMQEIIRNAEREAAAAAAAEAKAAGR